MKEKTWRYEEGEEQKNSGILKRVSLSPAEGNRVVTVLRKCRQCLHYNRRRKNKVFLMRNVSDLARGGPQIAKQ